jgi:hypothetical protein
MRCGAPSREPAGAANLRGAAARATQREHPARNRGREQTARLLPAAEAGARDRRKASLQRRGGFGRARRPGTRSGTSHRHGNWRTSDRHRRRAPGSRRRPGGMDQRVHLGRSWQSAPAHELRSTHNRSYAPTVFGNRRSIPCALARCRSVRDRLCRRLGRLFPKGTRRCGLRNRRSRRFAEIHRKAQRPSRQNSKPFAG